MNKITEIKEKLKKFTPKQIASAVFCIIIVLGGLLYMILYNPPEKVNDFGFVSLSKLPAEYTMEQAVADGCYYYETLSHSFNDEKNKKYASEFLKLFEENKEAFIRKATNSVEGDLILEDFRYKNGLFYYTRDISRDKYASKNEDKFTNMEFYILKTEIIDNVTGYILSNPYTGDEMLLFYYNNP